MEFIDLKTQYARLENPIHERLRSVLKHGRFINGPEVGALEQSLAEWTGTAHCVTCANGTDALHLALLHLGVGPGDAVITPPFTFAATAEVIAVCGATPVFVDVNPVTYNLDPQAVEAALSEIRRKKHFDPRGIIAVDLFGLPAEYDKLLDVAGRHGMFVLQDGAQSFGATLKGKRSPGLADIGTTSFFPAKPLGCYGDGGAIFTNDDAVAERLRSLRSHGQGRHKYEHKLVGLNSRLDTLQAAILLEKLRVFPEELELRQQIAERYTDALEHVLQVPQISTGWTSAWAQYSVCHEERDRLVQQLKASGVPTMIYYPQPLHLQPCYAHLGYREGELPVSEKLSRQIFSLPMGPYLTPRDQDRVISALESAVVQKTIEPLVKT